MFGTQRLFHFPQQIMIAGYPDLRSLEFIDLGSKTLVGFQTSILCNIACAKHCIYLVFMFLDQFNNICEAFLTIHANKLSTFIHKQMRICYLNQTVTFFLCVFCSQNFYQSGSRFRRQYTGQSSARTQAFPLTKLEPFT